jgi:hypothetical protein
VGFGGLNDNIIIVLNKKLSILHTLEYSIMRNVSKVQQECILDGIPHTIQTKVKVEYCHARRLQKQSRLSRRQQCKCNWWNGFFVVGYHSIESKHIWQMANETWVDDFGLVSIMVSFAWVKNAYVKKYQAKVK